MSVSNQYSLTGSAPEMYERNMVPAIFEPFARGLLECADLLAGEHILDAACGTGIVLRLACPKVAPAGSAVGLDINAGMLAVARKVCADESSLEWKEGDVASMPFYDGKFDVALCQHGLQYFPDKPAALAEMRRVLRPSGRLVFSVWRPVRFNIGHAVFADVLERHVGEEAADTRRAPFKFSNRSEIRTLVVEAGFSDVSVRLDTRVVRFPSADAMVRIMMAGTPLATAMENADSTVLPRVITDVTDGLSEYIDDQGLSFPMQAWVVTAKR